MKIIEQEKSRALTLKNESLDFWMRELSYIYEIIQEYPV